MARRYPCTAGETLTRGRCAGHSGAVTTAEPGQLTDDQVAELAQLRATALVTGEWTGFVDAVMARRAAGVTVARIAAAAGVSENRVRQVCRAHGHQPPDVRVPGWVTGREAAASLGVSAQRLAAAWWAGEFAGVSRTVGWDRLWHLEELPDWWAAQPLGRADAVARCRAERHQQIRDLAAGGSGLEEIALAVGVSTATVRRQTRSASPRSVVNADASSGA